MNNGGGNVYAKILEKNDIEENPQWKVRIRYPTSKDSNLLQYDITHTKLIIKETDTEKCYEDCELYITIENLEEAYDTDYYPVDFIFSFFFRTDNSNVIAIDFGNYIKGNVDSINSYNYYSFVVSMNTDRVVISFKSKYATLVINLEADGKPSIENNKWKIESTQYELIIAASELGIESLQGKSFIIGAVIESLYDELYSTYKFRVMPQYKDTPNIVPLSFEESELCETKQNNNYCYYYVYLVQYTLYSSITVQTEENSNAIPTIVKNEGLKLHYDLKNYNQSIIDLLPTLEKAEYKSTSGYYGRTSDTDIYSLHYMLIGVYIKQPQKVSIYMMGNDNLTRAYVQSEGEQFHSLFSRKEFAKQIDDVKCTKYSFNMFSESNLKMESAYDKFNGREIVNTKAIFNFNGVNIFPFKLTSRYSDRKRLITSIKPQKGNINKITLGQYDIQNYNEPFPSVFSFALSQQKRNLTIEFSFTADDQIPSLDEFTVDAYLVTNSFLRQYTINPQLEIEGTKEELHYNEESKKYEINFFKSGYYGSHLFFKIAKSKSNTKEYSTAIISTNAKIKDIYQKLEPLIYQKTNLTGAEMKTFLIETTCEGCDIFYLEIGKGIFTKEQEDKFYIDYAIEKYSDYPVFKNGTEILFMKDTEEKGISSHLFSINSTSIGKKLLISFYLKEKGDYTILSTDTIPLMIKY